MERKNYIRNGVLPILLASSFWGIAFFLRKTILPNISPLYITFFTAIIASIFIYFYYKINIRRIINIFKEDKLKFISLAVTGTVVGGTLMLVGLMRLDLGIAALLEKLQPIFTIIIAFFFIKEKFNASLVPYAILAVIASYFIVVKEPLNIQSSKIDILGVIAILGAALSWSIAGVIGKNIITKAQSHEIVFIRFLVGGIILIPILLIPNGFLSFHYFNPDLKSIVILIFTAIIATAIGYTLFYYGMKLVSAGITALLELITPVVALLLGVVFLHETLTLYQYLAIPLLLFSIYKLTK